MALDDLVEDAGGTVDRGYEYDIERKDRDRGFRVRVDIGLPDEEDKYLETYLSPYTDDDTGYINSRKKLTNDIVEQVIDNLMESIRDDKPGAKFQEAEVYESTTVRKVTREE